MLDFLKRKPTPAVEATRLPPAIGPGHPEYVPTPKAKVPGAQHPLVKASQDRQRARAVGVGIVYGADGRPKITADWVKHLNPMERQAVDANLAAHGYKIAADAAGTITVAKL